MIKFNSQLAGDRKSNKHSPGRIWKLFGDRRPSGALFGLLVAADLQSRAEGEDLTMSKTLKWYSSPDESNGRHNTWDLCQMTQLLTPVVHELSKRLLKDFEHDLRNTLKNWEILNTHSRDRRIVAVNRSDLIIAMLELPRKLMITARNVWVAKGGEHQMVGLFQAVVVVHNAHSVCDRIPNLFPKVFFFLHFDEAVIPLPNSWNLIWTQ
jgi:hypothetical protein